MELYSLIIYLLVIVNLSFFLGSHETPASMSQFTRSQFGKLVYLFTVLTGLVMFFFIPIMYSWWYFLLEFLILFIIIGFRHKFIFSPFIFGPLTTIIYIINLIVYVWLSVNP